MMMLDDDERVATMWCGSSVVAMVDTEGAK